MQQLALITGVSRALGLGYETARQLAQLEYQVIITARELQKVQALAEQLQVENLNVSALQLDIENEESVQAAVAQIEQKFDKLDVLINNAAAYFDAGGNPLTTDLQMAQAAFNTNVIGAWRMVLRFLPLLRQSKHARIVNVSSGAGSFGDPIFGLNYHRQQVPVYGITKLALNGLTVKLARQLQEEGILVNAVCPGWVATYPGTIERGARPVAEGAKSVVWAATLPKDGPTGGFFRDGMPLAW